MAVVIKGAKEMSEALRKKADPSAVRRVVRLNGAELTQKAQRKAPVDTGTLRRSIRLNIIDDGMTAEVGSGVEYAPYVEYGTRFMEAQSFLRPSLTEQLPQFKKDLKAVMKTKR